MNQGAKKNLKVLYRARLLSCIVLRIDVGKQCAQRLWLAINMLADAWKAVTPATFQNCFWHAGFVGGGEADTMDPVAQDLLSAGSARLVQRWHGDPEHSHL